MDIVVRTTARVPDHTPERYNRQIEAETTERVGYYARNSPKIDARLRELDEEWDIERTLEANAATRPYRALSSELSSTVGSLSCRLS